MRLATTNDAAQISELEVLLFPDNCMNETTLANELEVGECWLVHDAEGKKLLGYILVRRDGDLLDILRLGVLPQYQYQGIGTMLLERVSKHGAPMILTVKKDNKKALRLYFKCGFRIVGQLASEEGWIMKR